MSLLFLSACFVQSNVTYAADNFLKDLPSSVVCKGEKISSGVGEKVLSQVSISIQNAESENPVIDVSAKDENIHFKIGDNYRGSLKQQSNCAYYFTKTTMHYLCHLMDTNKPLTLLEIQRANVRSSFSSDMVCGDQTKCIKLSLCTAVKK